jgi:hypothetical protein
MTQQLARSPWPAARSKPAAPGGRLGDPAHGAPAHRPQVKAEWELHSSLEHPHIIRPYLAVEDQHRAMLILEYAQSLDAYTHMETSGLLPAMSEVRVADPALQRGRGAVHGGG